MDIKELIAKIRNTSPYENLESLLGKDMGSLLYKLVEESEELSQSIEGKSNEIYRRVRREMELEDLLRELIDECDGNNFSIFRDKIKLLINKRTR